jgi:hypothetical protein
LAKFYFEDRDVGFERLKTLASKNAKGRRWWNLSRP